MPTNQSVTVAVDAMGGDHGPEEVVRAVAQLSLEQHNFQVLLVGDGPTLGDLLVEIKHNPERIAVHHAAQAVPMSARPDEALAAMPEASILVAARLVALGKAD